MIRLRGFSRNFKKRLRSTRGQSLVEYSILLAAFAAILVAMLLAAKNDFTSELSTLSSITYYAVPMIY